MPDAEELGTKLARRVVETYGTRDVFEVATGAGVSIFYQRWPLITIGECEPRRATIRVNTAALEHAPELTQPLSSQALARIIIAHELGHFFAARCNHISLECGAAGSSPQRHRGHERRGTEERMRDEGGGMKGREGRRQKAEGREHERSCCLLPPAYCFLPSVILSSLISHPSSLRCSLRALRLCVLCVKSFLPYTHVKAAFRSFSLHWVDAARRTRAEQMNDEAIAHSFAASLLEIPPENFRF